MSTAGQTADARLTDIRASASREQAIAALLTSDLGFRWYNVARSAGLVLVV
jgi:hypothetical protein